MRETPEADRRVRCRQIGDADVEAVAELLARGFAPRPKRYLLDGIRQQRLRAVPDGVPRYGYLLESGGRPVGAVLLIFFERPECPELRCNVASWYVEPSHRAHATLLSDMALKRKRATYLNVTPAPKTWPILEAQGYQRYCNGLVVSFPALAQGNAKVAIEWIRPGTTAVRGLPETDLQLLREHASYGCASLAIETPDGALPFVFQPFRIRSGRLPLPLAQLVYCRSVEDFVRHAGPIGRALLWRGSLGVLVDAHGPVPGLPGVYTERLGHRFFKGPRRPQLADLANTELVLFGP